MTVPGAWVVTTGDDPRPFTVRVEPRGDGWTVSVARDGERWSFALAAGPEPGRVLVGDRPVVYDWDPGEDGRVRIGLELESHALRIVPEVVHRLARLTPGGGRAARGREVRSPMPGLILAVEVEEGTTVEAGAGLMIVEAMKMENEITAPVAGVVRDLSVASGDAVERDALLCRIAPGEAP